MPWRSSARMQDKRKWLPGWQRIELVGLCLDRGMSRREAASFRRVSVATVQYWVDRYRRATDEQRESGDWAADRRRLRSVSRAASVTRCMTVSARRAGGPVGVRV